MSMMGLEQYFLKKAASLRVMAAMPSTVSKALSSYSFKVLAKWLIYHRLAKNLVSLAMRSQILCSTLWARSTIMAFEWARMSATYGVIYSISNCTTSNCSFSSSSISLSLNSLEMNRSTWYDRLVNRLRKAFVGFTLRSTSMSSMPVGVAMRRFLSRLI